MRGRNFRCTPVSPVVCLSKICVCLVECYGRGVVDEGADAGNCAKAAYRETISQVLSFCDAFLCPGAYSFSASSGRQMNSLSGFFSVALNVENQNCTYKQSSQIGLFNFLKINIYMQPDTAIEMGRNILFSLFSLLLMLH